MQRLVDSRAFGGFPTGVPDDLVADGVIGGVMRAAREQPNGRFAGQPAIMCAQFLVQIGAEQNVAVLAAFTLLDMHHHARRIDIGEFEGRTLGAAHTSPIERHENGAIEGDRRGIDQAGDLFRTPDDREMDFLLWVRDFVTGPGSLQDLAKEKTQGADDLIDRVV